MAVSDPIADLLTRIRNATKAEHRFLDVEWSKLKENIVKILEEEGFISKHLIKRDGCRGLIRVYLSYAENRTPIIQGIKRVSKPGKRHYAGAKDIKRVLGGLGISILSTSKGVMTGAKATKAGVGGEVLCEVW